MPRRENETIEAFVIRSLKNEVYEECAKIAEGGAPRNEPGRYWEGRFTVADEIRQKIDAE